jgi:hypothetical protein
LERGADGAIGYAGGGGVGGEDGYVEGVVLWWYVVSVVF